MAVPAVGGEAKGLAGVFGNSINPLQYYISNQAQQRARQDKLQDEYRKRRDNYYDDLTKWAPDKVWDDMYDVVNTRVQKDVRDYARNIISQNNGVIDEGIHSRLDRAKGDTNVLVSQANKLKDVFMKSLDDIEKNPMLNKAAAKSKLYDLKDQWHNSLSTGSSADTDIQGHIMDNPGLYDKEAVVQDFMKNRPVLLKSTYGSIPTAQGDLLTDGQLESKLDYEMERDPKTGLEQPRVDPQTGQPVPIVNDALYTIAMRHPEMRNMMEENGKTPAEQKAWLATVLPGYDPRKNQVNIKTGFKLDDKDKWSSFNGINFSGDVDPKQVYDRFQANDKFIKEYNPAYMQHALAPFEGSKAIYTDASGNPVTDAAKAKKIEVEFSDKDKVPISSIMKELIFFDNEKYPTTKDKLDAVNALEGKKGKITFDTSTPEGRVQAHLFFNRLEDKFSTKGNAYGDDYRKVVEKELGYNNAGVVPSGKVR